MTQSNKLTPEALEKRLKDLDAKLASQGHPVTAREPSSECIASIPQGKRPAQKKYTITVNYGYDIHSVTVSQKVMEQIKSGKAVCVRGQGFHIEGDIERDDWSFHCTAPGSLEVECENGHQVYIGELSDATITEI